MSTLDVTAIRKKIKTEQVAWGIMLISFAVFCLTCIGLTVGLYLFVFESTVPVPARLEVGRGTVIVTDADFNQSGVRQTTQITRMTTVSTDQQSQATIIVESELNGSLELIAAITVKNDSAIRIQDITGPRFSRSTVGYHLELEELQGEFDILVMGSERLDFSMHLRTAQGASVDIEDVGRYSLLSSPRRTLLTSHSGKAIVTSPEPGPSRLVSAGEEAIMIANQSQPSVGPSRENLLENSAFVFDIPDEIEQGSLTSLPGRWGCTNIQNELPRGQYLSDSWRDRPSLRLMRGDNATSNGQTRCIQQFGDGGLYVGDKTFLELETTFLINFQSLSKCGSDGSECPLMLRIDYIDQLGVPQTWIQGFYYADDPVYSDWPSRCTSCTLGEHRRVNEKVWYAYKSGNLMRLLSQQGAPERIVSVEFYGSGHQYDVYMSEINLFGGLADIADIESSSDESD